MNDVIMIICIAIALLCFIAIIASIVWNERRIHAAVPTETTRPPQPLSGPDLNVVSDTMKAARSHIEMRRTDLTTARELCFSEADRLEKEIEKCDVAISTYSRALIDLNPIDTEEFDRALTTDGMIGGDELDYQIDTLGGAIDPQSAVMDAAIASDFGPEAMNTARLELDKPRRRAK